jgi:hypothetical protein
MFFTSSYSGLFLNGMHHCLWSLFHNVKASIQVIILSFGRSFPDSDDEATERDPTEELRDDDTDDAGLITEERAGFLGMLSFPFFAAVVLGLDGARAPSRTAAVSIYILCLFLKCRFRLP